MNREPTYQRDDIIESQNKLTFETCESLQDMLVNKFPDKSKGEIYRLLNEWISKYHIIIDPFEWYNCEQTEIIIVK